MWVLLAIERVPPYLTVVFWFGAIVHDKIIVVLRQRNYLSFSLSTPPAKLCSVVATQLCNRLVPIRWDGNPTWSRSDFRKQPLCRHSIDRLIKTVFKVSAFSAFRSVCVGRFGFRLLKSEEYRVFSIDAVPDIKYIFELFIESSEISTTGWARAFIASFRRNPPRPVVIES